MWDDGYEYTRSLIGGCETCYTTVSLFELAKDVLRPDDIKLAKGLLMRNQNRLSTV